MKLQDAFRSTILFLRSHKGPVILLISTLSLIFFASLILHSLTRLGIRNGEIYKENNPPVYTVHYQPADQAATDELIDSLYQSGFAIRELNLLGETELLLPSGTTIEISEDGMSISSSFANADHINSDTPRGTYMVPLIACCQPPIMPIEYNYRARNAGDNGIFLGEILFDNLNAMSGSFSLENSDVTFTNGETRDLAGVFRIASFIDYDGILVDRSQFFTLTDHSNSLQIVFADTLTEEQDQQWIARAQEFVTFTDIEYPLNPYESSEKEGAIQNLVARVLILACLLCAMRLIAYVFLMRKQEFIVLRMLGASYMQIEIQVLVMTLVISGIATAMGMGLYLFVAATRIVEIILPELSPMLLVEDVIFFLFCTLAIGFSMFISYLKLDVTHASEEV